MACFIVTVGERGIVEVQIPVGGNLAEEKKSRALVERCSVILKLLDEVAKGVAQPIASLAPAPSPIIHAKL